MSGEEFKDVDSVSNGEHDEKPQCPLLKDIADMLKQMFPDVVKGKLPPPASEESYNFYETLYHAKYTCGYKPSEIARAIFDHVPASEMRSRTVVLNSYIKRYLEKREDILARVREENNGGGQEKPEDSVGGGELAQPEPAGEELPEPASGLPTEELQRPPEDVDAVLGRKLVKALSPIIARHFGRQADRLTEEYIANIFAIGTAVELKYAPWCLNNGMDRVTCVTQAMEFFMKYKDAIPELESEMEELVKKYIYLQKMFVAYVSSDREYLRQVLKATLARQLMIDATVIKGLRPDVAEEVFNIVEKYIEA